MQLGYVYLYAERYQEAIAPLQKALDLDPSTWLARVWLGHCYSALGRHLDALEVIGRELETNPDNQVVLQYAVVANARAGRRAVGRRFLDSLQALATKGQWVDPQGVGWSYAWLGEIDRAFAYYSRAIDERSMNVLFLKVDWLPDGFKADPRYHALLRRVGLE
jgi:tetratricopeptide (TPR) repeat protein